MKLVGNTEVIVATVVPFTENGDIDRDGYRRVVDYCTPDGVTGIFVNGHAGEGAALSHAERLEILELTRRQLKRDMPVMCGIISLSTADAIRQARDFVSAGCDIPVLFPPPSFAAGGALTPAAPVAYVSTIAEAVNAPLSIFQYPVQSGCGYTTETLVEISRIPNVAAIKEGSDTMTAYEETWRKVKAAMPEVAVLPSNYDWFLPQLAIGADGILSGLASLAPHMLVQLWRATRKEDLRAMRDAYDRLYPVVRGIYGRPPRMDMHTRIKEGLKHLGVIKCANPRGPLLPVSEEVRNAVCAVVDEAGLRAHAG